MRKYIFPVLCAVIAIIAVVLMSCVSTLPKPDIDEAEFQFEPVKLEPRIDPNPIRIDIIRNIQRNDSSSISTVGYTATGSPIKTSKQYTIDTKEAVEYSPVCIHFGNGLCLDTNGNLYLSIDEILSLGANYTLFSASGVEAVKVIRADENFTSSNSTLGLSNKTESIFRSSSLFIDKRQIVSPLDNGYSLYAYNALGGRMSRQDTVRTDDSVEYRIVEGKDLCGKTRLTQDEKGITGHIRWYMTDIAVTIRLTNNKINMTWVYSSGKKVYITIRRDNDAIIAALNENYGTVVEITENKLVADSMAVPGLLDTFTGGNSSHVEINYTK